MATSSTPSPDRNLEVTLKEARSFPPPREFSERANVSPDRYEALVRDARAVGDHDRNSFRLRLDPVDPAGPAIDMQPGMTVWLRLAQ